MVLYPFPRPSHLAPLLRQEASFSSLPPSQVDAEHSHTLEALAQSHHSQLSRLSARLSEEQQQSQALRLRVAALQGGMELGDDIITGLCAEWRE